MMKEKRVKNDVDLDQEDGVVMVMVMVKVEEEEASTNLANEETSHHSTKGHRKGVSRGRRNYARNVE